MARNLSDTVITLPAPAKLNLFLHITGKREDGYHNLQTVFQLLDYSDLITLEHRDDGVIERINGLEDIPEETDLCIRAAKLLKEMTNSPCGANVSVDKKLPIGGGIGGGSSDAASVLHGLNRLWNCGLSDQELANLGLKLGADVPVFVMGESAWAEGVGEQITPIELPEKWFLVVHPNISVSTAKIFADQGLTRDCEPITIARFLKGDSSDNISNVFEPVVRNKYPEIADALDWLSTFSKVKLTGTGSCLFASFNSKTEAQEVFEKLPKKWQGFVAQGINKSPLFEQLHAIK